MLLLAVCFGRGRLGCAGGPKSHLIPGTRCWLHLQVRKPPRCPSQLPITSATGALQAALASSSSSLRPHPASFSFSLIFIQPHLHPASSSSSLRPHLHHSLTPALHTSRSYQQQLAAAVLLLSPANATFRFPQELFIRKDSMQQQW